MSKKTLLWFDGAAEPNPGTATWAFVVREDDPPQKGRYIHSGSGALQGRRTNNEAEYCGLGCGLRWLVDAGRTRDPLVIRGDSQLVINQGTGEWECRSERLIPYLRRCLVLLREFRSVELRWIPRAENSGADELTRSAWESATGRPFPERPTKRPRLPGQQR